MSNVLDYFIFRKFLGTVDIISILVATNDVHRGHDKHFVSRYVEERYSNFVFEDAKHEFVFSQFQLEQRAEFIIPNFVIFSFQNLTILEA